MKNHPYASRGGVKLEHALREFKVEVKDKIVLDVGASTGGFTDCLLQHGAKQVYAVDVGYGLLALLLGLAGGFLGLLITPNLGLDDRPRLLDLG